MKKSVVIATALVFLLVPGVLFAQACGTSKVLCKGTLELNDEQCAKLMDLRTEQQMANIKLGAELKILELKLSQELSKDDPSAKELESLVSKIAAARGKLHQTRIDHLLQAKKILEPEQWKTFRMCFGSMGDLCSTGMDCMGTGGCNPQGCSPGRMGFSGAGQCGPANCISMDKNCASMCCGKMMGGSSCEVIMEGMKGCAPGKSSCQPIERKCIQIQSEE